MKIGRFLTVFEDGPESPIYISPEINGNDLTNVPAVWIFNDGEIHIYTKRKKTGAVLGKPIKIKGPKHEHTFAEENSKKFRPCLGCGREYRTMFAGKTDSKKS